MIKKYERQPVKKKGEAQQRWRGRHPWNEYLCEARRRCNNPKATGYRGIGGRGIKCLLSSEDVKGLWLWAKADQMRRPALKRFDKDKDYTIENSRFVETRPRRSA